MRIYIADLAAYNAGKLIGKWLDLDDYTDAKELKDAVADWMRTRGIEEIAVHDYDDCPADSYFGECPSFVELFKYHELYTNHGSAFASWFSLGNYSHDCDEWEEQFQDVYVGQYDSWVDFAMNLLQDTGALESIPEHLRCYFDYSAYARDLKYDYTEADGFYFQNY